MFFTPEKGTQYREKRNNGTYIILRHCSASAFVIFLAVLIFWGAGKSVVNAQSFQLATSIVNILSDIWNIKTFNTYVCSIILILLPCCQAEMSWCHGMSLSCNLVNIDKRLFVGYIYIYIFIKSWSQLRLCCDISYSVLLL